MKKIEKADLENLKITIEEFERLKAKHKILYVLNVEIDEDEIYEFIVCRPSRPTISAVNSNKNNFDKSSDIIIKNMVVGGDIEALEDGVVFSKVMKELSGIVNIGKSFLAKA